MNRFVRLLAKINKKGNETSRLPYVFSRIVMNLVLTKLSDSTYIIHLDLGYMGQIPVGSVHTLQTEHL